MHQVNFSIRHADLSEPILITQPKDLEELAKSLAQEPIIAVDTESNSLYVYRERVCLIQFSTPYADYLVDPLALKNLSSLASIFANPHIEKVFHAAEYDLICMKRDFGFSFANLFDTMITMRILGKKEIGLGTILENEFSVTQDKRLQRANWGQRPLPPQLLAYARLDSHYLIPLRHRLLTELKANDLWALALEDFNRLCHGNEHNHNNHENEVCWRINGSSELTPRQATILQEVCLYRDQVARAVDRPLFKVFNNKLLLSIAAANPTSLDDLKKLPGINQSQVRRHGKAILQAVQRGLQAPIASPHRSPRPNEQYMARLEALRQWRKKTARQMGVESDIVLPRDLLYAITERNPRREEALAKVMHDVPWRLEHFGKQILEVIRKC